MSSQADLLSTPLATMRAMRRIMVGRCADVTTEQLHLAPAGFGSSLAWHVGHVAVTTTLLTHARCGAPLIFDAEVVDQFRKGTSAADVPASYDLAALTNMLESSVDQIEEDAAAGAFDSFEAYETSAGVPLASIEQAVNFLAVHDGIHVGYIMALKRVVLGV